MLKTFTAFVLLTMTIMAGMEVLSAQSGYDLFQKALATERADGDLRGAIQLYERVVKEFAGDRALVARALVRMAECHLKLGNVEARGIYERVVREFADQTDEVTEASARLRALGAAGGRSDPAPVTRRVWAPDFDFVGAPSPGGRYLTFVDWTTGDLSLRDVMAGTDRRVTSKDSQTGYALALESTISPDGQQVAYAWFGPDANAPANTANDPQTWLWSLRVIRTDGRDVRVLYASREIESFQPTAWSADGRQILVLLAHMDGSHRLATVAAATGTLRVIKSLDWRQPERASFSPDGRSIVYDFPPAEDSPNRDVFLLDVDGTRETVLAKHPSNDVALGWIPGTNLILFASDRTTTMDAWTIAVENGTPRGEPQLVKRGIGRIEPLGFSNKGALYYGVPTGMEDVFVARIDPQTGAFMSPSRATERSVGANRGPVWSPDGRLLAFASGVRRSLGGGTPDFDSLIIRTMDTADERPVVPQVRKLFGLPRWSADGRSLIAHAYDRKGREGVYTIDLGSGEAAAVVHDSRYDPAWSADGATIFYRLNQRSVMAHRLDGTETELYRGSVRGGMSLSPDGQYLAFRSLEPGSKISTIKVLATAGGEPRVIGEWPAGAEMRFAWEADSRHVRVAAGDSQSRVSIGGGAPQVLPGIAGIQEMAFSPDGKYVAFTAGASKTEVWVMENFLPATAAKP